MSAYKRVPTAEDIGVLVVDAPPIVAKGGVADDEFEAGADSSEVAVDAAVSVEGAVSVAVAGIESVDECEASAGAAASACAIRVARA